MAKIISEEQYNDIVGYVKKAFENIQEGAAAETILMICNYQDYIDQLPKKKQVPKLTEEEERSWKLFWSTWPSTKSVGKWKSTAKMKPAEHKMKEKWRKIIKSGRIGMGGLQLASEVYLKTAEVESDKKGRNEMEFRSGLEPWLNQEQFLYWAGQKMPQETKQSQQYTEA